MCEAYVLASELKQRRGNYAEVFARYKERLAPFVAKKQRSATNFASAYAPRTAIGLAFRNFVTHLLQVRPVTDYFVGRGSARGHRPSGLLTEPGFEFPAEWPTH